MKRSILAVGLRPIRASAQVADPEHAARHRVNGGAVRGAVVRQHALDRDSVPGEEPSGSPKEGDHCGRLVVVQNLRVRQARAVIDRDVDVLPAGDLAVDPRGVSALGTASPVRHADDAGTGASLDPSPPAS